MPKFKLYYWPILTSLWQCLTYIISYLISICNNDVYPLFPFISDTGTLPPESCVFGQMLNLGSLFMFITMYIRTKIVFILDENKMYTKWNNWSNFFGCLACLGISLVANFQETSVLLVHILGSFLAFIVGTIYFSIQTYLTCLMSSNKCLKYFRLSLNLSFIALYVIGTVFSNMANEIYDGRNSLIWEPHEKGYVFKLIGALSEWIMAIFMNLYILSFVVEFKVIEFDEISFVQNKYVY